MTILVEGLHPSEWLLSDEEAYSRDVETLAAASGALITGTVLGRITASKKVVAYDDTATDGSETAIGILEYDAEDSTADQSVTVVKRIAEVIGSLLTGLDAAGTADLLAAGIVVR